MEMIRTYYTMVNRINGLKARIARFIKDRGGQTMAEYVLIVLVALALFMLV